MSICTAMRLYTTSELIDRLAAIDLSNPQLADGQVLHEAQEELKCMQWQPIESVPKDGTAFLCGWWNSSKTYWWVVKAHWANGAVDGGWDGAREPIEVRPTHWMPLPSPPAVSAESTK